MAENTNIEWCDHTFNPWIGCTKVSPGCDNCYAARQDGFRRWTPEGWGGPRRRTSDALWRDPVKWNARAEREGRRYRVFCASLADVFDNEVPDEWRRDLFALVHDTPHLDWLLLTKRIGNAKQMMRAALYSGSPDIGTLPLPNVWLGATVVNQAEAERDIPKLLKVPARVRFLSIEPMLGPVDLRIAGALPLRAQMGMGDQVVFDGTLPGVDWVICGGESGPGARPMHPDWARSLRDQCAAAGVAFHHKQNGEWLHEDQRGADGRTGDMLGTEASPLHQWPGDLGHSIRLGKKASGRLLDGVTHDGFPHA